MCSGPGCDWEHNVRNELRVRKSVEHPAPSWPSVPCPDGRETSHRSTITRKKSLLWVDMDSTIFSFFFSIARRGLVHLSHNILTSPPPLQRHRLLPYNLCQARRTQPPSRLALHQKTPWLPPTPPTDLLHGRRQADDADASPDA